MRRTGLFGMIAALCVAAAGGVRAGAWRAHDISGLMPDLAFTLVDDNARSVSAADYSGKVKLLYFGFTHCKDICPETLAMLALALQRLGDKADGVRVLFVSVDPKRDTPKVLKGYVAQFSPEMVGLTGAQDQLQTLSKRYRVAYSCEKPDAAGDYDVNHSSAVFAFDRQGRVRLLFDRKEGASDIAADLGSLLSEP